jgi:hypothetical protein
MSPGCEGTDRSVLTMWNNENCRCKKGEEAISLWVNIERVYGCEVWVDQNPFLGMPRINLVKKGVH